MLIIEKTDISGSCYSKMDNMINSYTPVTPRENLLFGPPSESYMIHATMEANRLKRTYDEEQRFKAHVSQKKWEESTRAYWERRNKQNGF